MPPKQCPACGRFLRNAFVDGLAEAAAPCPACGDELRAGMFGPSGAGGAPTGVASDRAAHLAVDAVSEVVTGLAADTDAVSVRPPDLEPASVRDTTRDVLAGWDATASPEEIASWRRDRRPFPTDTVVVVGSGILGAIAGGGLGRASNPRRPVLGVIGGVTLGLTAGAVARRIWQLR